MSYNWKCGRCGSEAGTSYIDALLFFAERHPCQPQGDVEEVAAELAEARTQLQNLDDLVAHARKISPSPSMTLYVADVERALGMDAPTPHKLGGNDGSTPSGSVSSALPETGE